ncbi:nuclear transport factor 2 family protein [Nocardia cerradoensis]|uniref:nuclear transport factor 2 family protein n=1 Tax=Nocardia cerradoensis TaxID=85688 RepID=UPI0002F06357|nr:nuclear transport factor 2 family protein [Nocardia cerradoensis]NKY44987.1 nuclear transport factor 2 family protein [Nocardia cerradoensis]
MTEIELTDILRRLRRVEDELAIMRIIASYGPLVDAGQAEATAELWCADGEYDVEGWQMRGRDQVRAMVDSSAHRTLITAGSAHFQGPARIAVDGDEALAVFESLLVHRESEGYQVLRASVHRLELRRESDGWRIARRTARLLDGGEQARELLSTFAGRRGDRPSPDSRD